STTEIHNRWVTCINLNTRLKHDRILAHPVRYGRKAVKSDLVFKTWNGVLMDEHNLSDDWIRLGQTGGGGFSGYSIIRDGLTVGRSGARSAALHFHSFVSVSFRFVSGFSSLSDECNLRVTTVTLV
ncbi:hypothetical protein BU15DRAFT_56754, partial [Melanogaster broomeanus]